MATHKLGDKFNRLTLIRRNPDDSKKWIVRCDCGIELEKLAKHVASGAIKSCGCLHRETLKARALERAANLPPKADIGYKSGEKRGRLTFLNPSLTAKGKWLMLCECGTEKEMYPANVRSGKSTSCGCYNAEALKARFDGYVSEWDASAYSKEYRVNNKESLSAAARIYREANKEKLSEAKRRCYQANPEKYKTRIKANYAADPEASITRERLKATLRKEATPSWANIEAIKSMYRLSRKISLETGVLHHVDHVIPLQSEFVCGLHVQNNLSIIPATENWKKHNSFEQS